MRHARAVWAPVCAGNDPDAFSPGRCSAGSAVLARNRGIVLGDRQATSSGLPAWEQPAHHRQFNRLLNPELLWRMWLAYLSMGITDWLSI